MTQITRRQTAGFLLAASLMPTASLALPALKTDASDMAERLAKDLNDRLGATYKGAFSVPAVETVTDQGQTQVIASIRLDWPPGTRQRQVRAANADTHADYDTILQASMDEFSAAWPGCFA